MPLRRGEPVGYHFDRRIFEFTMLDEAKVVRCGISAAAMDGLEKATLTIPAARPSQFLRLRDRIEHRAAQKYSEGTLERTDPVILLRSADFFPEG
jgi:hypothetical protein